MSKILATFPGKIGDILWALPTIREIARQAGEPVDLVVGDRFAGLVELLKIQPYLGRVEANPEWKVQDTAPMSPRVPSLGFHSSFASCHYDKVYHLGYEGWPKRALPLETWDTAFNAGAPVRSCSPFDPWLFLPPVHQPAVQEIYLGWTDEWFELKLGLTSVLANALPDEAFVLRVGSGSRWLTEGSRPDGVDIAPSSLLETASVISSCALYVGCLSSQWVLANALGVPCVVVEPNPHRHNPIFWWDGPIEKDGRARNRIVRGNDGLPTFDARAMVQAVEEELGRKR